MKCVTARWRDCPREGEVKPQLVAVASETNTYEQMIMALKIEPDFGKWNIFLRFPSPLVTLIVKKEGVVEIICRICNVGYGSQVVGRLDPCQSLFDHPILTNLFP